MIATPKMMGERIKRKEDPRFITGTGKYTDDIKLPGALYAAFLRSEHGHARINGLDVGKARSMPGVIGVYTGKDIAGQLGNVPCGAIDSNGNHYGAGVPMQVAEYPVLAGDEVTFQGQAIACVVATDPYLAHDALDAIEVSYGPLPAVVDLDEALEADSPKTHTSLKNNVGFHIPLGPTEDAVKQTEELFSKAEMTASFRIDNQRLIPMAMEPRAVAADYDPGRENLTVWSSSQIPHIARTLICAVLGHPETNLRFVAPDVGGGFGSKLNVYPEEYLIPFLAKKLGKPIKWNEKRREGFATTTHGRGQVQYVDIAFNKDGTWLACKLRYYLDLGANLQLLTPAIGSFTSAMASGCYKPQAFAVEHYGVLTNKMATDAYRGAGRPEATLIAERTMDVIARETGVDPAEVRRRNFLTEFPVTTANGLVYDSGDYSTALDKALQNSGYKQLREEQKKAREQGKLVGIGLSSYVELCGVGPSWLAPPGVGFWDVSTVRVEPSGVITVLTGISPHGQGEETSFAQIVADELGVSMDNVRIIHSDTASVPYGNGTYGSRGMAVGGGALMMSVDKVKEKAKEIAAHMLDAQVENVEYEGGAVQVKNEPNRSVTLNEIAFMAYDFSWKGPGTTPEGLEPGLEATSRFEPSNLTFPFGTHVCQVEVDAETGEIEIKRFVAVDDCGRVINPLIVDGQVHGGIAQGIGQALYEGAVYDETGQLVTGELTEYAVPKANMVGHFECDHTVTPTPVNPLGAKGVGEAGTIGSTAAVFNAVMDALQPLGIKHLDMPFSPHKVWSAIQQAKG